MKIRLGDLLYSSDLLSIEKVWSLIKEEADKTIQNPLRLLKSNFGRPWKRMNNEFFAFLLI